MTDSIEQREREQFEEWYVADALRQVPDLQGMTIEYLRSLRDGNGYGDGRSMLNGKWEGWQARAALSAPQAGVPEGWRRMEDGVPDPNTTCLVYSHRAWEKAPSIKIDTWAEQHESPVAWSSQTIPAGLGWDEHEDAYSITHWMPLPPAPGAPAQVPAPGDSGAEPSKAAPVLLSDAARAVLAERQRQIDAEGWTQEHDDEHSNGSLARAAACYALHAGSCQKWSGERYRAAAPHGGNPETEDGLWPWDREYWKPKSPRQDLVRSGALILAEIERLDRANGIGGE